MKEEGEVKSWWSVEVWARSTKFRMCGHRTSKGCGITVLPSYNVIPLTTMHILFDSMLFYRDNNNYAYTNYDLVIIDFCIHEKKAQDNVLNMKVS